MTLHWGQAYINKCIPPDLQARFNEVHCDPFYGDQDLTLPHYNGKTGEKLFAMPGERPVRISRRKLRNLLSEGLDIHVWEKTLAYVRFLLTLYIQQYGKKCTSVSLAPDAAGVTATFADGSSASGSFLAGCDSANSVVREFLVGKEKAKVEDLDINMFNVSCAYPAETSKLLRTKHPNFKNSYHPELGMMYWLSIMDVKEPDRPETWLHQSCMSWIGAPRVEDLPDQASRTAFFHERAAQFAEPWRSAGTKFPENLSFGIDRTTVWDPSVGWSDSDLYGRVTLAGDSAHAMPPHRGQGLNNGLNDAAVLVEQLAAVKQGKKSLKEAVEAYEEDMRERTVKEIPISIAQARMVHSWETLMSAPFIKLGMHKQAEAEALERAKKDEDNTAEAT